MNNRSKQVRNILITGGAGFIGSNLAQRLLADPSTRICIFDSLARNGVSHNLTWLRSLPGSERLRFVQGDVRDNRAVSEAVKDATEIYHLAAQVAVTTSIEDPREDFEVNALGTFNVLEAARNTARNPFFLFTSTNKVYGSLHGVPVRGEGMRYTAEDPNFEGVKESEALDFHSPYGCSKGAAEQYVRDYARIYNLPTVVFRMSCIAGPRQFGTEDQGWVAHFLYSVLERKPITIYGDGRQVRDILHVYDLLDAMEGAHRHADQTTGKIYNLGGGLQRSVSVIEMIEKIARITGVLPILRHSDIRPGDQPLYISNTHKVETETGWSASYSVGETLKSIHTFWKSNQELLHDQRSQSVNHEAAAELVSQEVA
jgi:CDP-paratose 2-epimerase